MAACFVDLKTCKSLAKDLKRLRKSYRGLDADLEAARQAIERSYQNACHATRLKMPHKPELNGKVWKYDISSAEMRRHPRECLRLMCILEEVEGRLILFGVACDLRRDLPDHISPKAAADWFNGLLADRARQQNEDEEPETEEGGTGEGQL